MATTNRLFSLARVLNGIRMIRGGGRVHRLGCAVFCLWMIVGSPMVHASDSVARSEGPRIDVSTDPTRIHPNTDFVTVQVRVRDLPATSSEYLLKLSLDAPPSTWLSTDFPVVEGTRLLDLNVQLNNSSDEFEYRFPIRGSYNLSAKVFERDGSPSSPVVETTRTLQVSEHPADLRNASLLLVGLFLFGLILGVVLRRSAIRSDDTSSGGSAAAVSVLAFFLVSTGAITSPAYAHGPGGDQHHSEATTRPDQVENEYGQLQVDVSDRSPSVGELVTVQARFRGANASTSSPARFVLECVHLEEGVSVFRMDSIEPSGELEERIQFVDGAPHHIRVTAEPVEDGETPDRPEASLLVGSTVDVTAVEPPTGVVVRMMGFLLGVFVVGMIGGFLSQAYAGGTQNDSGSNQINSSGHQTK